jgi:hypothetical protein
MNCDYCGKIMTRIKVKHINICQPTQKRVFCSKSCKNNWCFDIHKGKIKIIPVAKIPHV